MALRVKRILTVLFAAGLLAACSTGTRTVPIPSPSTTSAAPAPTLATTAGLPSPVPVVVSTTPTPPPTPSLFPKGYPKLVTVASLPFQVMNWYQTGGYTKAVAVAPGVWAPLPPGATMADAATAGVLDGFCASVKAYEAKYLDGQEQGGACW